MKPIAAGAVPPEFYRGLITAIPISALLWYALFMLVSIVLAGW